MEARRSALQAANPVVIARAETGPMAWWICNSAVCEPRSRRRP
ncbi:MAG: hypothetical protein AAGA54_23075 [Myxococcota bacterium]